MANLDIMASPSHHTLAVFELAEAILFYLEDPVEVVRMQRVCLRWRDIITTSPRLQEACWYRPFSKRTSAVEPDNTTSASTAKSADEAVVKFNPVFYRFGMDGYTDEGRELVGFSLETRVYDNPGSWTTMLATQPPQTQIEFEIVCHEDDMEDNTIFYWIQSTGKPLLVGDIMAVLAECQNRQECGMERWWWGIEYRNGQMRVGRGDGWFDPPLDGDSEEMEADGDFEEMESPDDVSIKVLITNNSEVHWFPAFSFRRVERGNATAASGSAGAMGFLHEMQLYKVATVRGKEYECGDGDGLTRMCTSGGEYRANLVVVLDYDHPYLQDCRHIYRLLSDV